jgi:hypothetical protein
MLIYLITSLPRLYIGKHPMISKKEFVQRVQQCFSTDQLFDFLLLTKIDDHMKTKLDKDNYTNSEGHSFLKEHLSYIMKNSRSNFLYLWAKRSIDIEESIVGLLCKKNRLSQKDILKHSSDQLGSTAKIMLKYYDSSDLGLSKRFSWFNRVSEIIKLDDLEKIEKTLDLVRLQLIDSIKTNEIFHMDVLLAYYLELSILERQSSFNRSFGEKMLQNLLDSIVIGDF